MNRETYINEITLQISSIQNQILPEIKFFYQENTRLPYIGIYILVLILLHKFNTNIFQSKQKILQSFTYETDRLLYQYAKTIHESKEQIHDFKSAIEILFWNKKQLLKEKNKNYLDYYNLFEKDARYLTELTGEPVASEQYFNWMKKSQDFLRRSAKLQNTITAFLIVWTIWLYRPFAPKNQ